MLVKLWETSIYFHDTLEKSKLTLIENFVNKFLEVQIEQYDLFIQENSSSNNKNEIIDNYFTQENEINGLNSLLLKARVYDPAHKFIFIELAKHTFSSKLSIKERASNTQKAWQKKALYLRDKEQMKK